MLYIMLYILYYLMIPYIIFILCYRSEGRVPNGIFDPWVRWDGGLDSVRNSSVAAAAAVTHKKH